MHVASIRIESPQRRILHSSPPLSHECSKQCNHDNPLAPKVIINSGQIRANHQTMLQNDANTSHIHPHSNRHRFIRTFGLTRRDKIQYPAFRESVFYDTGWNPRLKHLGSNPTLQAYAKESRQSWTTNGAIIYPTGEKTSVVPGSAFRNECTSADNLYSTVVNSLGYEVYKSLRGTSLCSTTERFKNRSSTPATVGPGSYNTGSCTASQRHFFNCTHRINTAMTPSNSKRKKKQVGNAPGPLILDEWKKKSDIPCPQMYTIPKCQNESWIEKVENQERKKMHQLPSLSVSGTIDNFNYLQGHPIQSSSHQS